MVGGGGGGGKNLASGGEWILTRACANNITASELFITCRNKQPAGHLAIEIGVPPDS